MQGGSSCSLSQGGEGGVLGEERQLGWNGPEEVASKAGPTRGVPEL